MAPPSGSIGDQKSMEDQQRDLTNLTGKERKKAFSKFLEPIQPNTGQKSQDKSPKIVSPWSRKPKKTATKEVSVQSSEILKLEEKSTAS